MAIHAAFFPATVGHTLPLTFAEAVRDNQDEIFGVALRILGDRDAAMDATSATLVKAYRSWARYDQTRPVRHWLLRIAANEAITIGRARTRERARTTSVDVVIDIPAATPAPHDHAVAREDRERV